MKSFLGFSLALSFVTSTEAVSNVLGLFPFGSDSKSAAMESSVDTRDVQSLFYNPAGLSLAPAGLQGEFGVGRLVYGYEHPRFDPVKVSLFSPVVSAGWRSESQDGFVWGLAVAPSANATLKIEGLPRRVNGKPESLKVETLRRQIHAPLGAAWSHQSSDGKSFSSVGASLLGTYDERKLKADAVSDGNSIY